MSSSAINLLLMLVLSVIFDAKMNFLAFVLIMRIQGKINSQRVIQ